MSSGESLLLPVAMRHGDYHDGAGLLQTLPGCASVVESLG